MHLLPVILLAILLMIIAVLLVILSVLFVRNHRRFGTLMPPRRPAAPPAPQPVAAPGVHAALPPPLPPFAAGRTGAYLEQAFNGGPAQRIPLDRPLITIGRDPACDIRIDERFVTVSRRHAQIAQEDGAYVLSDLNSSSGVYVDGARIGRNRVRDGAVISLGQEVQFTFHQAPARGSQ